jgi:hypothetical protein
MMKLVLLDGFSSEGDYLLFSLPLILWKGHPLTNDFAARLVIFFHARGSLAYFFERRCSSRPRALATSTRPTFLIRCIALLSFGALRHRVLVRLPARFPSCFSLARAELGATDNSW